MTVRDSSGNGIGPDIGSLPPGGTTANFDLNDLPGWDWDEEDQALSISAVSDLQGRATLTLEKSGTSSSVLDLKQSYSGKVLRILGPPDQAGFNPVTYIGNGGEIATRAWMIASGHTTGSGDSYAIAEPISSGTYPFMIGMWSDVKYGLALRSFDAEDGYLITGLGRDAEFRFMMPEDGRLQWGPIEATTPAGIDTGLSRLGVASIAIGNGGAGDFTGTLKLTKIIFADGSEQTVAGGLSLSSAHTWTGQQTFNQNVKFPNGVGLQGTKTGGTGVAYLSLDAADGLSIGSAALGDAIVFQPGTNQEIRFLNAATTAYIMSMEESTRRTCIGGNQFDTTLTVYDPTATTGDTVLSIRAGAAREARLNFGSSAGSYDVGLQRAAAGVLNVMDGSTTATNYRDLRMRNMLANGATDLGGGVGVIAVKEATTPPGSTPSGGGVIYVESGALKYKGSSGTVTTLGNA